MPGDGDEEDIEPVRELTIYSSVLQAGCIWQLEHEQDAQVLITRGRTWMIQPARLNLDKTSRYRLCFIDIGVRPIMALT